MMTYVILAAGKGSELHPLTLKYPKTSYRLDGETTVLQRMVRTIRRCDRTAEIAVVVGYLADTVKAELQDDNVRFVRNPFYEVTGSITSLWFAREYLERENVTILNGDVVFSDAAVRDILVPETNHPFVLVDSTRVTPGGYNAVVRGERVLVMSKKLENPSAGYCFAAKLDAVSSRLLKEEIDQMVAGGMYSQYFEDALVQMIMFRDFELGAKDIAGQRWAEVNSVDDLLEAQEIHRRSLC